MSRHAQRGYNLQRWRGPRGLRRRVLARDQHRCQLGLPGCTGMATTVHISPLLGGDHRRATLDTSVAACHSCHGRVDGGRSRGGRGRFFRPGPAIPAEVAISAVEVDTHTDLATNQFLTAVGRRRQT